MRGGTVVFCEGVPYTMPRKEIPDEMVFLVENVACERSDSLGRVLLLE